MGKIAAVDVQTSSFTYLVQVTRANNATSLAWQRSSPSPASFFLSFGPFVEETSVRARSLVSAEPSSHDERFKEKRKGCKEWGRSQPSTSKHPRSRTWCRSRTRTTQLPSRGSDLLHHLQSFLFSF